MAEGLGESAGQRLASYRKLAGYTQREFADHAHLSLGAVRKVERGERLPTHGFLYTAARTLAVSVEELTGQPYRGQRRADEQVHAPIAEIRTVARAFDLPSQWRTEPRSLSQLAAEVAAVDRYRAEARYSALGLALPALLEELTGAVHVLKGKEQQKAGGLLASAYYMAYTLAYRLGYADLASLLVERQRWAAKLSEDPLAVALASWSRAGGFQTARDYTAGLRLLGDARVELADEVGASPSDAALTVLGSLRLREATLASRAHDSAATVQHLDEAKRLATNVAGGKDRIHYHLTFGPVNTAVHEIAADVELRNPEAAAAKARLLRLPASMPRTRRGHHHLDAARAFLAAGDRGQALAAIQQARQVAPQQTRYHPMAREVVRVLAGQYRRVDQDVRALSAWMGSAALGDDT